MIGITVACLVISGLAAIAFYGANYRLRAIVDDAIAPLKAPERQFGYSLQELVGFKARGANQPTVLRRSALEVYRRKILVIDIGFAIGLGIFCLAFWLLIAQHATSLLVTWLALIGGAAGLLYGLFDVCEDVVLRNLLQPDRAITGLEARAASVLTQAKIATICRGHCVCAAWNCVQTLLA
jgi:hypothetical protein